ncbi:MAG: type IV secretion system DNA-binding domain-containing protein [Ruminococcus sp.]|nr:type IV secretion system DNA-binding domain-containing protein [Ruminococcus sp.]
MITRETLLSGTSLAGGVPPGCPSDAAAVIPGSSGGKKVSLGITDKLLSSHLLLLGSTGSGKTNTLMHLIPQLRARMGKDDVMLVFDPKLDYRCFHRPGDPVIGTGSTEAGWNIFKEVLSDGAAPETVSANSDEISEVIFAEQIEASAQPFFPMAARDIFSAVLTAMALNGIAEGSMGSSLTNKALSEQLRKLDADKLHALVRPYPMLTGVMKYVGNGRSDQSLGILAELQSASGRFLSREFCGTGGFSVRQTVKHRDGRAIFLEYDPSRGQAMRPAFRLMTDLFLKEALSPRQSDSGRKYLICDEAAMLAGLGRLEDGLNFGRSLGLSVVAGLQSLEQLYKHYGENGGRIIASAFQTVFCFHTTDEASRKYITGLFGSNRSAIQYISPSGKTEETVRDGCAVEDWDISSLGRGEAIVGMPYCPPFRFTAGLYRR